MSARDRPRLGRGLASLWGEAHAEELAGSEGQGARLLSTELLEPNPFQPRARVQREALAELVQSIRTRGILQPLLVRPHPAVPDRYQIVAGERRWRAAQAAGLHEVPTLVRELNDAEATVAALVENLQREDLNAIEEADGYRRLMQEFGLTQDGVAESIGKSRSHVANTLRLLKLPETVKGEVRRGALSAGHARALLGLPDPQAAALDVIARGLSVRQTEALSTRPPTQASRPDARDSVTRNIERDLSERLGLRIQITAAGTGGTIRIHYQNLDQLDGVITLLRGG